MKEVHLIIIYIFESSPMSDVLLVWHGKGQWSVYVLVFVFSFLILLFLRGFQTVRVSPTSRSKTKGPFSKSYCGASDPVGPRQKKLSWKCLICPLLVFHASFTYLLYYLINPWKWNQKNEYMVSWNLWSSFEIEIVALPGYKVESRYSFYLFLFFISTYMYNYN